MATADEVEVVFEADINGYKTKVNDAAETFDRSMRKIETSSGRNRAAMQQLSFQLNDISQGFALGVRPMTIWAQQGGQVIQALQLMGGEGNKFLQFLGGPWGIGLSAAAAVLVPLIANLFKAGDSVDDLVEKLRQHFQQTQASGRANEIFAGTIEGVRQAAEDERKALDALNLAQDTAAEKALKAAEARRQHTIKLREDTVAALANAKAAQELIISNAGGGVYGAETQGAAIRATQSKIDQLNGELKAAQGELAKANKDVVEARADVIIERANATAEEKTNRVYDQRIDAAKRLAIANGTVTTELKKQVDAINKAREAELKRLEDSKKAGSHFSNAQSGRELTFAGARAIAEAAGLKVNSDYRSPADQARLFNDPRVNRPGNPVAAPGHSAHEGVNGKWALDIQLGDGVTPELLRKVFAAQGVTLSKVLREQGHYHIEGKRSQDEVDAEKAAAAEQKAADALDRQVAAATDRFNVERQVNALRASGGAFEKQIADWLESDFQIESQFPELARSTNKADQDRLQTLKDIARAAIDERYAREGSLLPKDYGKDMQKELDKIGDDWLRQQQELAHKEQEQIRTLAGFYRDAFRGSTQAIWRDFKQTGLDVIALVLAKFTLSRITGGGFDFGSALSGALGAVLPGFAGGGSMMIGGRGGVDQNVLSLNGQPMARVGSGELLNITNPGLMRGAGAATQIVVQVQANDYFDAKVAGISHPIAAAHAQSAAAQMGAAVGQSVMKAIPSRLARFQRDGT